MTKRLTRAFLLQLEEGRAGKADVGKWREMDGGRCTFTLLLYIYIYIERKPDGCRNGEQRTVYDRNRGGGESKMRWGRRKRRHEGGDVHGRKPDSRV